MFEMFIASTWLFWSLVIAFVLMETWATESESPVLVVTLGVVGIVVFSLWSNHGPLEYAAAHPLRVVTSVPIYFAVGALWSLWKWHGVVARAVLSYNKAKEKLVDKSLPLDRKQWTPSVSNNSERIVTWIVGWPFSALWSALSLPRALATEIYRRLASVFQRMVDRAFAS